MLPAPDLLYAAWSAPAPPRQAGPREFGHVGEVPGKSLRAFEEYQTRIKSGPAFECVAACCTAWWQKPGKQKHVGRQAQRFNAVSAADWPAIAVTEIFGNRRLDGLRQPGSEINGVPSIGNQCRPLAAAQCRENGRPRSLGIVIVI